MSSGLILFTNDGDLAQKLMRPAAAVDREYVVETREPIPDEMLEAFRHGISVEGVQYRLQEYRRHSARRVALILQEGKNREIRRVFAHFRLKVRRIYRNRYGPIRLGSLPEGQVRPLTENEVERLRHAVSGSGRQNHSRAGAARRTTGGRGAPRKRKR
jgi:23S rRNA pseudouridine2605 synthase